MNGLAFDQALHRYSLDAVVVPSVTQVLSASGLVDFSGIPKGVLEAAQARGTAVHSAVHYYEEHDLDLGQFESDFPEYAGYLRSWIVWKGQVGFVSVLNEHRVASRRHQVAGTFDALGTYNGHPVLIDIKTGSPRDVAADLQLCAYEALAREQAAEGDQALRDFFEAHHGLLARMAVQLKPDGPAVQTIYRDPRDFSAFLTLLSARRIVEARKGQAAAWRQDE